MIDRFKTQRKTARVMQFITGVIAAIAVVFTIILAAEETADIDGIIAAILSILGIAISGAALFAIFSIWEIVATPADYDGSI
ncbi:TPA: hypothetical protein NJV00_000852 [Corynebacterium striatum]|nr:hypothetical protein [Corynebacterium striatum]HAT1159098.1 hypothetical protein [Corynebacterium striatum]HAT1161958.1 hypothetical protein [Corynebacterium striatum]HAT1164711.1 hypothetical protein [Corynebacterium striatum]HAT1277868.1 hypothetical protein [Corynebacterium striatum]